MALNGQTTNRRQLRDYLLGRLPEDLAIQLDSSLFADDAPLQELEEEQNSLVEDFVYGRLTEEEQRTFQEQCAQSVSLREKVASLRILQSALERHHARSPTPFVLRLKQVLGVLSPAMALVLCFAAFLYVRERHRSAALVSQAAPPVATRESAKSHPQNIPAVAFLSANLVRGSASVPEIKIPPTGTVLELQVEVRPPSSVPGTWDIALLRGSEVIKSSTDVALHRLGQVNYLSFTIDADSLSAGSYRVRYSPHADPRATLERSFQVRTDGS